MNRFNRYMLGHYLLKIDNINYKILCFDGDFYTAESLGLKFKPSLNGFDFSITYLYENNSITLDSIKSNESNRLPILNCNSNDGVYINICKQLNNAKFIIGDNDTNDYSMFANYFKYKEIYYVEIINNSIKFVSLEKDLKALNDLKIDNYLNNPSILESIYNDFINKLDNSEIIKEIVNFEDFYDYKME